MNASYYDLLGVSKNADENEIKKSYKNQYYQMKNKLYNINER